MNSAIAQKADEITIEVNKKVNETELGTKIEQNYEHIKIAWNQISEFIQMMILNNNASLAILDSNKKVLMTLDKTGQHFYESDGTTLLGDIGVNKDTEDNEYLSFASVMNYGETLDTGMAWGIKTKSDNKFHPIMYMKNYDIPSGGEPYGQLELSNCDLVITGSLDEGSGGAIKCGNLFMGGNTQNGIAFMDYNGSYLLSIYKGDGTPIAPYDTIQIFDKMLFSKNVGGGNSFRIGTDDTNYCLFSDDGSAHCKNLAVGEIYINSDKNYIILDNIAIYGDTGKIVGDCNFSSLPTYQGNSLVWGSSGHKYHLEWTDSRLDFYVDVTNVGTLSDKRLKTEIQDIDDDFIKVIEEVEMKQFKVANRNGLISFGILAQDLIEIFKKYNKNPFDYEIIYETQYRTDDDTIYYAINYEQFLILKTKAQEQKLNKQEEIINNLIKRIEKLEANK